MRDKVIQTENDYDKDVFNGDVGIVDRIDPVEHEVAIRFDDRIACSTTSANSTRLRSPTP
jgi:ATP-dependent exoDNAse (exonuclease V) alpha subunit